jgi:hypothetical protein
VREKSVWLRIIPLLGAALLAPVALANPVAGTSTATEVTYGASGPVSYKGLSVDLSVQDSSGLNAINYNNSIYMLFEPAWSVGQLFFRKTPFAGLRLAGRLPLTYTMAGYDPSAVVPNSDHGVPGSCSNLTPSTNGNIDVSQVQRCSYKNTYRPTPGDFGLTLSNPGLFTIPGIGVKINPSVRLALPLSYESRYATMRFAIQGAVGLGRSFFGNKLSAGYSFGATKYSYQSTAATTQTQGPQLGDGIVASGYSAADIGATSASFYSDPGRDGSGSGLNSSYSFSHVFTVGYNITEKLNFSVLYVLSNSFAYEATCGTGTYGGVQTDACANANAVAHASTGSASNTPAPGWSAGTAGRAHRDTQVFYATLAYQLKDWVGLSVAWATFSPLRFQDNSFRQPFVSTNYDSFSSLNLGATFTLGYTSE